MFEINSQPPYTLSTLYNFCNQPNCADGVFAQGGLLLAGNGSFYGTTYNGGANGAGGTVFNITPGGALTTLHNFCKQMNCADGGYPYYESLVLATDGHLYGTTGGGGVNGYGGTIFKISPGGMHTRLYSFCARPNCADGASPLSGLVQATDGNFYGTTVAGGTHSSTFCSGCGTVFRITPGGMLTTLYNFCAQANCADGAFPVAGLMQAADGNLYGTTVRGGAMGNCPPPLGGQPEGCGTIFKITLAGALSTVYAFCTQGNCPDGAAPYSALAQATDGNFYGTTHDSGANGTGGTVFVYNPLNGTLNTLYSFCSQANCTDGADPYGGALLQATDGNFYGATSHGGAYDNCVTNGNVGCGTVFRLNVGLGPFVATEPTSGTVGTPVIILGNNLTGSTSVTFNGTPAMFTVSASEITTNVPDGATTGTVQVTTPGGTLASNVPFRVTPSITSFSPPIGLVGRLVVITGESLTGATSVTFGGVRARSFTVDSYTQITVRIPPGAKTGKIGVTTPGGTATSAGIFRII